MSGIAIIIKGADYSKMGLGKVTMPADVNLSVKKRIAEIKSDGGTLLYGTEEATIQAVKEHQKKLMGSLPRLDYIGYKGPTSAVTKLYSLDKTFDTTEGDELRGIIIKKTKISTDSVNTGGAIKYNRLLQNLRKVYYTNTKVSQGDGGIQYLFTANLFEIPSINLLFKASEKLHVQISPTEYYSYGTTFNESDELLVEINNREVEYVGINKENVTSTKSAGLDYWKANLESVSGVGLGNGGEILVLGC